MDIVNFLSAIGTIVTIETRVREFISNSKIRNNEKGINNIEKDLRKCLKFDDGIIGQVDDYISNHVSTFKSIENGIVFSSTDKERFVQDFFDKHNDLYMYKNDVKSVLNMYIDMIEKRICQTLSHGEKMIIQKINENQNNIKNIEDDVDKIINILEEQSYGKKIFSESKYNISCIGLLNEIGALVEKNTGNKIIKKSIPENFLVSNKLEDTIIKLQEVFRRIDIAYINGKMSSNFDNGLEALQKYIKFIAPDLMIPVNEKYDQKIKMIIVFINKFEEKSNEYYLSLGAMGLFDDYSDEKIYSCVMDILHSYFKDVRDVLLEKWKYRNYELLETNAQNKMQECLWGTIRYAITDANRKWIWDILSAGSISDVELAQRYDIEVKLLRKELYNATKTFLDHSYVNDYTTMMSIKYDYKEIIKSRLEGEINEN